MNKDLFTDGKDIFPDLGNLGKFPQSLMVQTKMPLFSVLEQDTGNVHVYNGADKTTMSSNIQDRKSLFTPLESADRYITIKSGNSFTGPMQFNNLSMGLPDNIYHNLEIFVVIKNLLQTSIVDKAKNELLNTLGAYSRQLPDYIIEGILKGKCTQKEIQSAQQRYKRSFMFDHMIVHDFAHQFELENIVSADYTLPPYHVYQYNKVVHLLGGNEKATTIAELRRHLRIAFTGSLKNELLISHLQYQFTNPISMLSYYENLQEAAKMNIFGYKEGAKNAMISIDCKEPVNKMINYVNTNDWLPFANAAEKISTVCEQTTSKLHTFIETTIKKILDDKIQTHSLIKKHGNIVSGVWKLISDEFKCPYKPYIAAKTQHVYMYHGSSIYRLLEHSAKQEVGKEYDYLYSHNHDTHLLLVGPDTAPGTMKLLQLEMFFNDLYADEISKTP